VQVCLCVCIASPQAKPSLNLGGVAGDAFGIWKLPWCGRNMWETIKTALQYFVIKNISVVHPKKYLNSLSQTHFFQDPHENSIVTARKMLHCCWWADWSRMVPQHPGFFTPVSLDYQIIYYVWENGDHPLLGNTRNYTMFYYPRSMFGKVFLWIYQKL